jgi:hypothetical protein
MSSADSALGLSGWNGPTFVGSVNVTPTFFWNTLLSVSRYDGSFWNSPTPCELAALPVIPSSE